MKFGYIILGGIKVIKAHIDFFLWIKEWGYQDINEKLNLTNNTTNAYYKNEFNEFSKYCAPIHKYIPNNDRIVKIIVFFRHGDRSPIKSMNSNWAEQDCVNCSYNECKTSKCKDGELTVKGFQQAKKLGEFIMNNYGNLVIDGPNDALHTETERTKATLIGVLSGSKMKNVTIMTSKSFWQNGCNKLHDFIFESLRNVKRRNNYKYFDNAMTNICGNVRFDCKQMSCSFKENMEILRKEHDDFEKLVKTLRDDLATVFIGFHELARNIKSSLLGNKKVILYSGHDSTLTKLLNGLGINYNKIPPYASGIFIEVIADNKMKKYIRVYFQGEQQNIGLYKQPTVTLDNFIKYLNVFIEPSNSLEKICQNFSNYKNQNPSSVKNFIESLLNSKFKNEFYNEKKRNPKSNPFNFFSIMRKHFSNYLLEVSNLVNRKTFIFEVFKKQKIFDKLKPDFLNTQDKNFFKSEIGALKSANERNFMKQLVTCEETKDSKCEDNNACKNSKCEDNNACENSKCEENKCIETKDNKCENNNACENSKCEDSKCEENKCEETKDNKCEDNKCEDNKCEDNKCEDSECEENKCIESKDSKCEEQRNPCNANDCQPLGCKYDTIGPDGCQNIKNDSTKMKKCSCNAKYKSMCSPKIFKNTEDLFKRKTYFKNSGEIYTFK